MRKFFIFIFALAIIFAVLYALKQREAIAPTINGIISESLHPSEKNSNISTEEVEQYLRDNIVKLSPVEAVLGGTWYVVSTTVDLDKKSGTVTYEDGHIQETRDFIFTTNEEGEILDLEIK